MGVALDELEGHINVNDASPHGGDADLSEDFYGEEEQHETKEYDELD